MTADTAPVRLQTFTNDGLRFDVIDEGPLDGPVIVALHGFPERAESLRAMILPLTAAGFRVLAPDQRGYSPGARPKGVGHYAMDRLTDDVLALTDQAGVARFHVLGYDWGAGVAWALAAEYPGRIVTLTALSVPNPQAFFAAMLRGQIFRSWYMVFYRLPWISEMSMLLLLRLAQVPGRLAARGDGWMARIGRRLLESPSTAAFADSYALWREPGAATATLNWYRAMFRRTTIPGRVRIPTLYVWATGDRLIGRAAAELVGRYVEGPYRLEILEGVSHWIPHERPTQVAAMTVEHIRQYDHSSDLKAKHTAAQ